jgi:hypothetical protein
MNFFTESPGLDNGPGSAGDGKEKGGKQRDWK